MQTQHVTTAALCLLAAFSASVSAFSPSALRLPTRAGLCSSLPSATSRRGYVSPVCAATAPQKSKGMFKNMFGRGDAVLNRNTADASKSGEQKVGVLFLNLGGPEKLDEVEDFLFNLFNDPDIIRLPQPLQPLQGLIARRIASSRAPNSREAYKSIGGGSPIVELTVDQGDKLQAELAKRGIDTKIYIGMRYWFPFTEEAVDKLLKDGINRLVIVPLYPQYSISTSGSSLRLLNEMIKADPDAWDPRKLDHTVVPDWFDHPGYVNTQARLISKELEEFAGRPKDVKVMFSAHGVPVSYVEAGDPYKGQIEKCAELIMQKVNEGDVEQFDYTLCFQSRVGPVKWLEPYTDTVLTQLGEDGLKNIVVVPLSFVSDHVETLEEIDLEYREVAEEAGITNFKRVPALNSDPGFIDALADLTIDALNKPALRVRETLNLYQGDEKAPDGSWMNIGITTTSEQINGRLAMVAISILAVGQVIKAGCPPIDGPSIAGKEPFCAAFSADGWGWLFDVASSIMM
mmetsp:Transcript_35206/g.69014  ORF Transcript_35206/g.69014 Transcript_35206/m.69014 type:complete len:515 (+) Transcript_35206:205-1749(+)|eukprot:CAMPEP_0173385672 /NCGR_PEP_ID=MMETSP1356-20130122/8279_1 /TAXON_ID=77927 ORGANISM="Hemiselmis virescens, Strain PCC157" /NCGR_SAMPLE_ID=MMETSP1356 /ASSEMBLY_ACC=CAM_ASM_000847 /LENGTH=514 /DNA_ID=CAMNT_0014341573 /DNA_START=209 /DNA_END=1753 /DNA_ORIENTATION=+